MRNPKFLVLVFSVGFFLGVAYKIGLHRGHQEAEDYFKRRDAFMAAWNAHDQAALLSISSEITGIYPSKELKATSEPTNSELFALLEKSIRRKFLECWKSDGTWHDGNNTCTHAKGNSSAP